MKSGHEASDYSEDGKNTLKYKLLLENYLKTQKEYVSKKRKLQEEKHKREILLHEVRFLRQKHKDLTKPLIPRDDIVLETHLQQESNDREEELVQKSVHVNLSIDENKSKKKKVSWNEKVVVYTYEG